MAQRGFRLVAPLPPGLASENAEVRLIDATGRRELRERPGAGPAVDVELRVPGGWLAPGRYNVAVYDVRAKEMDVPVTVYRFRIIP